MKRPVAAFIGLRMLRGRGGTGRYLRGAALAVGLSLVPLLLVMEASSGMIEGITARLLEVSTGHIEVALLPGESTARLREAAGLVAGVRGVVAAVSERQGTVLLTSVAEAGEPGGGSVGVTLRCVDPVAFGADRGLHRYLTVEQGSADLSTPGVVLLSVALADSIGVQAGGQVLTLATSNGEWSGPPRVRRLTVGGIYSTGYQELDRLVAYASLDEAARVLGSYASSALVSVKVTDPFADLSPTEAAILETLGPEARVGSWRDLERARLASFDTTRALLVFIMALIVLVAAANVSSAVLTLVLERRAEIAMLAGLGAHPRTVSRAFLWAGLGIGVAGAAAGIALGLAAAVNVNELIAFAERLTNAAAGWWAALRFIGATAQPVRQHISLLPAAYYLQGIPVRIGAGEVAAAAVGTVLASALAAWIPASRAGRLAPLEVLRRS